MLVVHSRFAKQLIYHQRIAFPGTSCSLSFHTVIYNMCIYTS